MAVQVSIIGVDINGDQIDEVFTDLKSAVDFMYQLREDDMITEEDWEE